MARLLTKACVSLTLLCAILFLSGCGGIDSGNVNRSASARLSANPPIILVEPFTTEESSFLVKLSGADLKKYKDELPHVFQDVLIERLQKIGAAKKVWTPDALPDRGWLIRGEFLRVYSGSGILRDAIGFGAGQSIFTTRVYVYDLSVSSTAYIFSFDTGITDGQKGSGSYTPGMLAAAGGAGAIAKGADGATGTALLTGGAAAGASVAYAEGTTRPFPNPTQAQEISPVWDNQYTTQYQDMARTSRQIRDVLLHMSGTPANDSERMAAAKTAALSSK